MNKIIALVFSVILLQGCASAQRVKNLEESVRNSREEVRSLSDNLSAQNKKIENLQLLESGDEWDLTRSNQRIVTLEKGMEGMSLFKLDHDKRWPPPVKLKGVKK